MNFRPYPGKLSLVSLAVSACIASGVAQGAGFALYELSAGAAGTANAGRAANPEDASIMSSNPAGIAFLDKAQWTFGGAVVMPTGEVKNASGTKGNTLIGNTPISSGTGDGGDFLSTAFVSSAYFAAPIDEKWAVGFGMYVPFAAKTEYDDDFAGRYLATKTELTNINLQSTLSYKFNDDLSFGLGLFASHIEGTLGNKKFQSLGGQAGLEMDSVMEGDDWGWNIGMLWNATDKTTIGMSYTSKVDFTVEGDLKLTGNLQDKAKGHLDLTLPDKFEIGITHQLDDRWTLLAGALWTGWSSFDEVNAIADEGMVGGINPGDVVTHVPENWKDSWAWSVGAEYKYNAQWRLSYP
ncbi:MAG: hypothetical protein B0D91_10430 [Oceanospirillales bacterium LUC14_002_19_P2]|nr:MAG: hypothetical protein B0D91_10430 [Oceanospirillales bacterium LUC14_002_19_P2]